MKHNSFGGDVEGTHPSWDYCCDLSTFQTFQSKVMID
jgi:hypothetical protein